MEQLYHPWLLEFIRSFLNSGIRGVIISPHHDALAVDAESPDHAFIVSLACSVDDIETAQHVGLTLRFKGTKIYNMSPRCVTFTDPWVLSLGAVGIYEYEYFLIIGNYRAEHPYDGISFGCTVMLYTQECSLILDRVGNFAPPSKRGMGYRLL